MHTGRMALDGEVDLDELAAASDGFTGARPRLPALPRASWQRQQAGLGGSSRLSRCVVPGLCAGADIAAVCSEAAHLALREDAAAERVAGRHLVAALRSARPSVSKESLAKYAEFGRRRRKVAAPRDAAAALFQAASYAATARFSPGSG